MALTESVKPKYLPPELSRISMLRWSNSGSCSRTSAAMMLTNSSDLAPMTLMGKLHGNSIRGAVAAGLVLGALITGAVGLGVCFMEL